MAEQLQPLLDQIRKEGVDKAQAEASEIISKAKEQAANTIREAEEKASALIAKAETDSEVFTQRSITTLEQSARDVLITVGQGVENIISEIVSDSVGEALSIDTLQQIMVNMTKACAENPGETNVELLVSEEDQKKIVDFFEEKFAGKIGEGVEIRVDNEILKGFKVNLADSNVYLDFTQEAIAEALSAFLRPRLSEIVSRVAKQSSKQA